MIACGCSKTKELPPRPSTDSAQVTDDLHFQHRPVLTRRPDRDLGSVLMHEVTTRLARTPGAIRTAAPALGEHNGAILGALGYNAEDIADLQ